MGVRARLHERYDKIFPNGNRNAASHRWAHAVLSEAGTHTWADVRAMMSGFCPVSGSPIDGGGRICSRGALSGGAVAHCCWPCACDLADAADRGTVRVNRGVPIRAKDRVGTLDLIELYDPCAPDRATGDAPVAIPAEASDVTCAGERLENSYRVDERAPWAVIGALQPDAACTAEDTAEAAVAAQSARAFPSEQCAARAKSGYQSGMGTIFRKIARLDRDRARPVDGGDGMLNIYGEPLVPCSRNGMATTGYTRTGKCEAVASDAGSHHVCIDISRVGRGKARATAANTCPVDGGARAGATNFCTLTGQPNWCDELQDGKPRQNWCVCQWAFSDAVAAKGCDALIVNCGATSARALRAYAAADNAQSRNALACLRAQCAGDGARALLPTT